MDFSGSDLKQIQEHGFGLSVIEKQILQFKNGFPFIKLSAPAVPGKGINVMSNEEITHYVQHFDKHRGGGTIIKFVPASGAATRMFRDLYEFVSKTRDGKINSIDTGVNNEVSKFFAGLKHFAFYKELSDKMLTDGMDINECVEQGHYLPILDYLLNENGLNYGSLPKGLIRFHVYPERLRTALEEHLTEAAMYAVNTNGIAHIHFTVSAEHLNSFKSQVDSISNYYTNLYNITFNISFSIQKSTTDTISVDADNNPFREKDGSLHFRPGGHGALIENLNDLNGDIIFIKNIDNVVHEKMIEATVSYKKALAGLLMELLQSTFSHLNELEKEDATDSVFKSAKEFAANKLQIRIPEGFDKWPETSRHEFLVRRMNKPIRVCGMVRNTGEPGGGPFWVENKRGEITLQIVESSQVNFKDEEQSSIFKSATHFNPVDIVCSVRDFNGHPFNLKKYIDPDTGFISIKSKDGKTLKAMELPGLWNGAMSDWITIFVEVPIQTFNPVKTINDLLRPEHR